MKLRGSYSKKKFEGLSPDAQITALDKLTSSLDDVLAAEGTFFELSEHIIECVSWMTEPIPVYAVGLSEELTQAFTNREAEQAVARFQSALGKSFKDTQLHLRRQDGPRFTDATSLTRARQVILILDNLRSAFNVGSIFRSAECLGLKEVWLCGVCATPDNPALIKTSRETADRVDWRHFPETSEAVQEARTKGYMIFALETAPQASSAFTMNYQLPLALVLGNESLGISAEVLELCDEIVSLPVQGWKNSLNVAVACAVCTYQIVFGRPSSQ